jgi:ABC-type branched-subunit amino acid transport system substrate-binding protein
MVGTIDQNSNMADPLYTKAGIANFSETALTEWDLAGSDSYPTVGSATFAYAGLGEQLGKAGYKNVRPMGVAESAAAITPLFATMGGALKAEGSTLLKPVLFPAATTDYAPVASQAMEGSPDAVVIIGNPTVLPPLGKAIAALGGKTPNLADVDGTFTPQDFAATGGANTFFNGALVTALVQPATAPEWAPYRAAIAKYQPGTEDNTIENASSQVVWIGMNAFKTIVSGMSAPVTAQSFKTALEQTTSLSTGGLTPTLNFTKPFACGPFSRAFNTTYYGPMTVKGGAFADAPGAGLQDASSLVLNGFGPVCKATAAQLGVS